VFQTVVSSVPSIFLLYAAIVASGCLKSRWGVAYRMHVESSWRCRQRPGQHGATTSAFYREPNVLGARSLSVRAALIRRLGARSLSVRAASIRMISDMRTLASLFLKSMWHTIVFHYPDFITHRYAQDFHICPPELPW
jgi:hypothetical protein